MSGEGHVFRENTMQKTFSITYCNHLHRIVPALSTVGEVAGQILPKALIRKVKMGQLRRHWKYSKTNVSQKYNNE